MAEIQVDPRQPRGNDERKKANVDNIGDTLLVEDGVAKPEYAIQIRRTPPWAEDQTIPWMVFDGECRYLAAKACDAHAIYAEVIDIPEEQVFERQVLTAMAREGLGPSAQLEALRRFDVEHPDVNAKNAAARLGMTTDAVRSLRKVNTLPTFVRVRYMEGQHTLEVCDSLSRIEGATAEERAERQSQASKAVAGMAPKKAREYITSQFLLRLADAPFDREDASLNPEAGVCSACPHRTGAQAGLFASTDTGDDCCKRPDCWSKKVAATVAEAPPPEEQKPPKAKKEGPDKCTQEDVLVAAALAGGNEPEVLDAMFPTKTREEIDASLERLAAHGNPKAGPALLDRKAKGQDLGGYSCGSARAKATCAAAGILECLRYMHHGDVALMLRSIVDAVVDAGGSLLGDFTFDVCQKLDLSPNRFADDPAGAALESILCEPGNEPPPPPPSTPEGAHYDESDFDVEEGT